MHRICVSPIPLCSCDMKERFTGHILQNCSESRKKNAHRCELELQAVWNQRGTPESHGNKICWHSQEGD